MTDKQIIKEIEDFAFHMRKHALNMAYSAGSHAAHFGGGMSIIEILAVLYGKILRLDKNNPTWEERDRFILSKGHGVIGYYAALAEYGYISKKDLETFEQENSYLMGHPVQMPEHGIEFTNGSLGMGLSLGIGTAISAKKRGYSYKTYVLVGDGECDEGAIWEGVMYASQLKLDNLCMIIDRNSFQLGGETNSIISHGNLCGKCDMFGWNAYETDGHCVSQLYEILNNIPKNGKPTAIVANTIKGRGFRFSENNNAWHHAVISSTQYEMALQELEDSYYGNN